MWGGIEAFRDEETVSGLGSGNISFRNGDELLVDLAQHAQSSLDFLFGVVGLDGSADNGNIVVLSTDAMHRWHHHHIDI